MDRPALEQWQSVARQDDWHTQFVGSDIRQIIAYALHLEAATRAALPASSPGGKDDRTLFERWRDEQSTYMPAAEREPPTTLVRVHVLMIPDAVPCSLDGYRWGALRTVERPRTARAGTVLVRSYHLDSAHPGTPGEPVGAGFEPECVFVRRDVAALIVGSP